MMLFPTPVQYIIAANEEVILMGREKGLNLEQ